MNERLTSWLTWLLGIDLPRSGEGVQWRLAGGWTWTPGTIVLACAFFLCSALWIGSLYIRERSSATRSMRVLLSGLRLSIVALVLLVMIFELRLHSGRTSLPILGLIVDESQSMRERDEYDPGLREQLERRRVSAKLPSLSRLDVAKGILLSDNAALMRQLARRYRLQLYTVAGTARRQPTELGKQEAELRKLEANGESTRLGTDLRAVFDDLRGTQPAAIVVVTDGITTEGPPLSEMGSYARRKAAPLFIVATGSDKPVRSIELGDLLVDEVALVNDPVDLDFKLTANGLQGQTIEVVLRNKKTGQVLSRQAVIAGENGQPQRVRMSHRPTEVGPIEYVIDVEQPRNELRNRVTPLSKVVDVRKARLKVLLVQGTPSYEYRYLKAMLARDETIDLKTVLQEADLERAQQDRSALRVFPVSREELFPYDVVIFGDVDPGQLSPSALANVADFVKVRGGGLLMISGPEFNPFAYRDTPLAGLLPIELRGVVPPPESQAFSEPIAMQLTPLGLASPHMQLGDSPAETKKLWDALPEVYWFLEAPELKPGARVLVEHPTRTGRDGRKLPMIVEQNVPPGKVIWHATDETYRWRLRLGDVLFARYWIQTIRYLGRANMGGNAGPIQLTSDRHEYQRGSPVQLRVRFVDERLSPAADDKVTVVVEGQGQPNRSLKLDRDASGGELFAATVSDLAVGNYHAWVADPTTAGAPAAINFKVDAPQGERTRLDLDLADMQAAATASGGKFYTLRDVDRLLDDLPPGRPVKVESLPPKPLWNNWRVLTLFVGLLVSEWLLRKRKGML